uniref:T-cell immunomodulatory protein TIP C2 domain-containing protein n=1 Tax=Strigamia maritima TaxID=126957 RepID=T1J0M9_STRMM
MGFSWRFLCFLKYISMICVLPVINSVDIDSVTDKVFENEGREINGVLAAFGDFNSDKLIDLFFILESGTSFGIYFASEREPIFNSAPNIVCKFHDGLLVTSIVPGDYNGDNKMDVLFTLRDSDKTKIETTVKILEGNLTTLKSCEKPVLRITNMSVEPVVLDYNGDMIPDLYGETVDGVRRVWIMNRLNWTYRNESIKVVKKIRPIHSNAFVNLDNDVAADIFVTTTDKMYEIWLNEAGVYKEDALEPFPDAQVIGQSAFLDIDLDGNLDHIVPVCYNQECTNTTIFVRRNFNSSSGEWIPVSGSFILDDGIHWGFYKTDSYPITLHVGDYNLDGYPDLLTIICYNDTAREAVILENSSCKGCQFKRRFKVNRLFKDVKNVILAAFYDIYQDGNLDFIFVTQNPATKNYNISAYQNKVESDVCFLKILVLSGLVNVKKVPAYGVNQPGPFISYRTTQLDGSPQRSCAAQLSQSAHFALQLPYTVFGLGQTPNFVDELVVGIPQSENFSKEVSMKTWKTIIPNSQMIIVPFRNDEQHTIKWYSLLFVKPFSHQVLIALIALVGTCALIILIIGGLHWKEKIADKKEKLQEAHKFHFDAM